MIQALFLLRWVLGIYFELSFRFSSATQSCLTLCDPMDCSKPGFPVHHQLPELAQTQVYDDGDGCNCDGGSDNEDGSDGVDGSDGSGDGKGVDGGDGDGDDGSDYGNDFTHTTCSFFPYEEMCLLI